MGLEVVSNLLSSWPCEPFARLHMFAHLFRIHQVKPLVGANLILEVLVLSHPDAYAILKLWATLDVVPWHVRRCGAS